MKTLFYFENSGKYIFNLKENLRNKTGKGLVNKALATLFT